jgi:hypothetical protein
MCVEIVPSKGPSRANFIGDMVAAAAFARMPAPSQALDYSAVLPPPPGAMVSGNARAASIAASSPFVRQTYATTLGLANQIADTGLRASVIDLLRDPKPTFLKNYPTLEAREALRQAFVREKFVDEGVPLTGLFPPNADAQSAPQPFWSASGSADGSHHAYPGGLTVHECFNATMATHYARSYDDLYFSGRSVISRDTAIGTALFHDAMKSIVFQWNDDGTPFAEATICGTGAHHVLSGAEALARGRSARFVITLLSAHAAPSLGDEDKVVTWCRAAAMLAGVDPIRFGLLRLDNETYRLAPDAVPIEAFVNYLSDHDYVLSVHAMHVVRAALRPRVSDVWEINTILARRSAIALYQVLSDDGERGFDREVDRVLSSSP